MAARPRPDELRAFPAHDRWLFWGLFVVCPLLFFTDLTRNPYYTQITLLNIFLCLFWILAIARGLRRKEWYWAQTALDGPLWALIAFCFLTWVVSFIVHPNLRSSIYSEGSRGAIFLIVNLYLAYAAAVRAQDNPFVVRWIWVFYATAAFASAYGIAQYFGHEWFWPHNLNPYGNRPVSTFGNPNFLSSYLVIAIPILLADFAYGVTPAPRPLRATAVALAIAGILTVFTRISGADALFGIVLPVFIADIAAQATHSVRPLIALALIATGGALMATLTRSSWAGTAVGLLIVSPFVLREAIRQKSLRYWLAALGALLVVAVIFWPKGPSNGYSTTVIERIAEVRNASEGTVAAVSQRLLIWICAWQMTLQHPLVGKGWGCFELFYPFFQGVHLLDHAFAAYRTHANNAHNEVLEYASQVGLLGLGLMALVWTVFFTEARSLGRRHEAAWRAFHWGLVGGVAGMLVDNLLNVSVHFAVPAFTFWWAVGTIFALDPAARQARRVPLERPWVRGLLVGAQVMLACFIVRAGCLWLEEVHFFRGFELSKAGADLPMAAHELETAYAWHALDVNNAYELANVYARMGEKDKALWMYQRALDANAGYDEIYFNRATVDAEAGRIDDAVWNYRMALAINPLSHDAYNALGGIYLKSMSRDGAAAQALYEQGTRVFPSDKDMWNNLGYIATQRGQWRAAYDAYRRALEIDPDFDLAWRNLRAVAAHVPESAQDPFLKQISLFQQADRCLAGKRWQDGLRILEPLKGVMPRSFRLHFYLGDFYFGLHDFAQAVLEYEAASQIKPDTPTVWQNLGVAAEQAGKIPEARSAFEHLLQLDPKNAAVQQHLSTLHP